MATPITITIGTDGSVSPFGGQLLRDGTDIPPLPEYEEYAEEVPGYAGRYHFGQDPRMREINLALNIIKAEASKASFLRQLAGWLNPANGEMYLVNSNEPDKRLKVRCLEPPSYKDSYGMLKLSVPLVGRPYYESVALNTLTGAGSINNKGNVSCPCTIVFGPGTNPSVTIGGVTVSYTGTIASGCTVTVDTEKQTAYYTTGAGVVTNVLANVSGGFPWLEPTPNLLTANQSDVETDLTGLAAYNTYPTATTFVRDTATYHSGAASAKATAISDGNNMVIFGSLTSRIPVDPSTSYTFDVYAKATAAAGRKMRVGINFWDAGGGSTEATGSDIAYVSTFTKFTVTGTSAAGSIEAAVKLTLITAVTGEILWWDSAYFYESANIVTTSDTVTITWRDWWI